MGAYLSRKLPWFQMFILNRFLISSTERLRPVFQYAIVTTVYIEDDPDNDVDR